MMNKENKLVSLTSEEVVEVANYFTGLSWQAGLKFWLGLSTQLEVESMVEVARLSKSREYLLKIVYLKGVSDGEAYLYRSLAELFK
jgi:hypothetical protein